MGDDRKDVTMMDEDRLVEIGIKGLTSNAATRALGKTIAAMADEDAEFGRHLLRHGDRYILASSPGWMRLPPDDAERVMERLRANGHEPVSRPLPPPATPAERSAARSAYIRGALAKKRG